MATVVGRRVGDDDDDGVVVATEGDECLFVVDEPLVRVRWSELRPPVNWSVLVEVPADVAGWYLLPVVPLPLALPSL